MSTWWWVRGRMTSLYWCDASLQRCSDMIASIRIHFLPSELNIQDYIWNMLPITSSILTGVIILSSVAQITGKVLHFLEWVAGDAAGNVCDHPHTNVRSWRVSVATALRSSPSDKLNVWWMYYSNAILCNISPMCRAASIGESWLFVHMHLYKYIHIDI